MQGTVKEFNAETRSGAVLLDDGTEIPIPAEAFSASNLRLLRFGQRVHIRVEGDGSDRKISKIELIAR